VFGAWAVDGFKRADAAQEIAGMKSFEKSAAAIIRPRGEVRG
jgi:hypothetical protein